MQSFGVPCSTPNFILDVMSEVPYSSRVSLALSLIKYYTSLQYSGPGYLFRELSCVEVKPERKMLNERISIVFNLKKPAEAVSVKTIKPFVGVNPQITAVILEKIADIIISQPIFHSVMLKRKIGLLCKAVCIYKKVCKKKESSLHT